MIIMVGYSLTEAADRDAAVAAFRPMVELARREGGCIDLHVSADPLDAERMCPSVFVHISSQGVKVLPTMSEN
jgi:quinol monooxygenase YgiN